MSVLRIACIGILATAGCGVAGAGDRLFISGIGKLWRFDLASGAGTVVVDGVNTGTKEGETHYRRGDYLVYNTADRQDAYAVSPQRFESMCERVTGEAQE